jgi:hypothetical protein
LKLMYAALIRASQTWRRVVISEFELKQIQELRKRLPGGACTHWKAPPYHGARQKQPMAISLQSGRSTTSGRHRGQRVGVPGQEPAAVSLLAVYGDPMTG